MKIAMSCTGEGLGHAARVVALSQVLRERYDIIYFCPERVHPFLKDQLGPDLSIESIPYFSFTKRRERIDYASTLVDNIPRAIRFPLEVSRIKRRMRHHSVSALISDYDPYGAYAADALGMPILQLNHPAVVLRHRRFSIDSLLAKIVSVMLMGVYHRKLIVSFYDGDVGPIVRKNLADAPSAAEDFLVVYLKPSYQKIVSRALRKLAVHNVMIFPHPERDIVNYLSRCKAVISSAGHQFMSEALVLGKPIFVIPQTGQFEQQLNAEMLEKSGWGTSSTMEEIDERLSEFLRTIDTFPKRNVDPSVRYRFSNDIDAAVARIDRFLLAPQVSQYRLHDLFRRESFRVDDKVRELV